MTSYCSDVLIKNIAEVLEKARYGKLNRDHLEADPKAIMNDINFTTLLTKMVKYDDYGYTFEQTIQILKRIQGQF